MKRFRPGVIPTVVVALLLPLMVALGFWQLGRGAEKTALLASYERVGDTSGARKFLAEMTEHYRGISPVLALTHMVEADDGVPAARAYLAQQLKDRPSVRGEAALIDLSLAEGADPLATLQQAGRALGREGGADRLALAGADRHDARRARVREERGQAGYV